jgi:flagellar protein FliO/FliZ
MNGSLGMGLLWFVLILAAIPAVLWLVKRTPYGAAASGAGPAPVRMVASMPIGPQQRVITLEVGQGEERRWLVLGVTAHAITPLHTLSPQSEAPSEPAGVPAFSALLRKVRDGSR